MDEKEMQATTAEHTDSESELRVYEVSMHVVPSLGEEGAQAEFAAIGKDIVKAGGKILNEEVPALFTLAYPMQRDIDRKRFTFTTSYFGWMKFETTPEAAHALKTALETRETLIRFLVIKTNREPFVRQMPMVRSDEDRRNGDETEVPDVAPVDVAPVSVASVIDAEIDKLLA